MIMARDVVLLMSEEGIHMPTTSRGTGPEASGVPLVLFQHFRGNLDSWDPALIDALAQNRRVITFDNAGVGGSTGTTPGTIEQMARDAIAFITAMQISQADLLGARGHRRGRHTANQPGSVPQRVLRPDRVEPASG